MVFLNRKSPVVQSIESIQPRYGARDEIILDAGEHVSTCLQYRIVYSYVRIQLRPEPAQSYAAALAVRSAGNRGIDGPV